MNLTSSFCYPRDRESSYAGSGLCVCLSGWVLDKNEVLNKLPQIIKTFVKF